MEPSSSFFRNCNLHLQNLLVESFVELVDYCIVSIFVGTNGRTIMHILGPCKRCNLKCRWFQSFSTRVHCSLEQMSHWSSVGTAVFGDTGSFLNVFQGLLVSKMTSTAAFAFPK
jgi:hypothetical protein